MTVATNRIGVLTIVCGVATVLAIGPARAQNDPTSSTGAPSGSVATGTASDSPLSQMQVIHDQICALTDSVTDAIKMLAAIYEDLKDLRNQHKAVDDKKKQLEGQLAAHEKDKPAQPSRSSFPSGAAGDAAYNSAVTKYDADTAAWGARRQQLIGNIAAQNNIVIKLNKALESKLEELDGTAKKLKTLLKQALNLAGKAKELNGKAASDPGLTSTEKKQIAVEYKEIESQAGKPSGQVKTWLSANAKPIAALLPALASFDGAVAGAAQAAFDSLQSLVNAVGLPPLPAMKLTSTTSSSSTPASSVGSAPAAVGLADDE